MHSRLLILLISIGAAFSLAGCETYRPSQYSASADNVLAMKSADTASTKFRVDPVTSTVINEGIMCSVAGPIDPPQGGTYGSYIHDALVKELMLAGIYADQAGIPIAIKLTYIDFTSERGEWHITGSVTIGNQPTFVVDIIHHFDTMWIAEEGACQKAAQALTPTVQDFINKIINSDQFKSAASGK